MANLSVTVNGICAGGNHVHLTVTVGGRTRNFSLTRDDLALDGDEIEAAAVSRIRSAVKEAGATNLAQIKAALEGKAFKV